MPGAETGRKVNNSSSALGRRLGLAFLCLMMLITLSACSYINFWDSEEEAPPPQPSPAKHWEQAMAFRQAGNLTMAATEMEDAIKADPNMYQAYYQLGRIYYDMGQKEQARRVWRVGLARAQSGPERQDYPKQRAMAEMDAALAALEPEPQAEPAPMPAPVPKPMPDTKPIPLPEPAPAPMPETMAPAMSSGDYAVLYSSNLNRDYAMRDVNFLESMGMPAEIKSVVVRGSTFHRVVVGCCTTRQEAEFTQNQLLSKGVSRKTVVMKVQ